MSELHYCEVREYSGIVFEDVVYGYLGVPLDRSEKQRGWEGLLLDKVCGLAYYHQSDVHSEIRVNRLETDFNRGPDLCLM